MHETITSIALAGSFAGHRGWLTAKARIGTGTLAIVGSNVGSNILVSATAAASTV